MDLLTMRGMVQKALRDESSRLFGEADINAWLNRALYDLATVIRLEASTTVASVAGTSTYNLPVDAHGNPAWVIIDGIDYAGYPLHEIDRKDYYSLVEDLDDGENSGNPTHFFIWGNEFVLFKTPATSGDTINIYYIKQPTELSVDGDVPEIPERWHDALVLFAIATALDEDDHPQSTYYWNRYLAKKAGIEADRNKRSMRRAGFRSPRWRV